MIKTKHRSFLLFIFLVYSLGAIILIKNYEYQINPDGTSYISIAQKYVSGDFAHAINKYWPPLFSWLISVFIYFIKSPLLAEKIFSLVLGIFTLLGILLLSDKFRMEESVRKIIVLTTVPIIWLSAFSVISPDLLLACLMLFYINIVLSVGYKKMAVFGFVAGILGGLMHLTKAFGFYFFIASFLTYNIILFIKSSREVRRQLVLNFIIGLSTFLVICGIWIAILSFKNQHFIFYVANYGNFTHAFVGPNEPNIFSFSNNGLLPPQEGQLSAWEDLSTMKIVSWNPLGSWKYFGYLLYKIKINSILFIQSLNSFSYLSIPLILILVYVSLKNIKKKKFSDITVLTLITIMAFFPLVFVWVDGRYLEPIYFLLVLIGGLIISQFRNYKKISLLVFAISLLINPIRYLVDNINTGKDVQIMASKISELNKIESGSKIASNNNYFGSVYLTFYLNGQYFGYPNSKSNEDDQLRELKINQMDYYFAWDNSPSPAILRKYKDITNGNISDIKIYKLKSQ